MKRLTLLIWLIVLTTACGHKDKGFMPERLLSENEMIDLLTDIQIIEADINYQKTEERERITELERRRQEGDTVVIMQKDFVKITRDCYDQLFEHHGINDSILSQNIRYYTERPAILEIIMDSVKSRLVGELPESQKGNSQ